MSNLCLVLKAKESGIYTIKTNVNDRYVLEEILKSGYNLEGEASGHIIFLNHNTTGYGLLMQKFPMQKTDYDKDKVILEELKHLQFVINICLFTSLVNIFY